MKQIHLIRHAESNSNAGLPTESPVTNPITELGRDQARRFAQAWGDPAPDLIVTSRFARTEQTAGPFMERFPGVQHERWDIEEWTQLDPAKYNGTTHAERRPQVTAYNKRLDPHYRDGGDAESLVDLFRRVGKMLDRASQRPEDVGTLFTHGHFMRATIWSILADPLPSTGEAMKRFLLFAEAFEIPNLTIMTLRHHGEWVLGGRWLIGKFWHLV